MNFRKLITYLTMGTAAAMPLAVAQNPTILQGSYISNVFGNSNFIKNPNAQTNIADVTVSNATVTRSTTTPLVATSEFLVTTSTATGSATWSTRTFDAGMKGQNCEARFTYRGFSVGSTTAQILQGANVVAQLTLTASTDPRIASINFPCGDLSSATTFRLQQATASLTGTNEIGGIYVGLATNMANVAQAEFVGSLSYQAGGSCQWSRVGDGTFANFAADSDCVVQQTTGVCNDSAGKIPGMTCNLTKPGRYEVIVQQRSRMNGRSDMTTLFRIHDGTTGGPTSLMYQIPNITSYESIQTQTLTASYEYTSAGTKTFQVQSNTGVTNTALIYGNETTPVWEMKVYRFPSSSELVVTPERQNVFAGLKGTSSGYTNSVTSSSWTKLTQGATLTRTAFGKAKVETNNDYSVTIENMPVGNYYVAATAAFLTTAPAGNLTVCFFGLADSATGGAQIASSQQNTTAGTVSEDQVVNTIGGVYQNTSVANRTFFVQAKRSTGTGGCSAFSDSDRPITITVIPLDQPSNSALYVQGPVLGAQTGAAIPAGYVGETKIVQTTTLTNYGGSNAYQNLGTITLDPGVWSCSALFHLNRNAATFTNTQNTLITFSDTTGGPGYVFLRQGGNYSNVIPTTFDQVPLQANNLILRSNGSQITWPDGVARGTTTLYILGYVATYTAGTPQYELRAQCVRIN